MMKKLFILTNFLLLISNSLFSQKKVTIGTVSTDTTALLEVNANNKGVLIPRVTHTQMLAIASPTNGLLVYNTDSSAFAYRNATAWVFLKGNATASNDWSTKGNAGTDAATYFIGTTDDVDVVFKRGNVRAGLLDDSSTSWGFRALNPASTGVYNTAIGRDALRVNTTGYANVANGMQALFSNTTGFDNVAMGFNSLYENTSGKDNTALGMNALYGNTNGGANIATGTQALFSNTTGSDNVANGFDALYYNTEGWFNTAHGFSALRGNTTGYSNTALGSSAGFNNSTGSGNVFIGANAGINEIGSNKLYISNNQTNPANTLVYGEFDNKILSIGGRLGISNTRPHGDLHLPQTLANRKIVLLEDVDNDHQFNGFGINTFIMRYQAAATTSSHVFYVGTSPTTSTELMRITGNGEVGIGKVPLTTSNDSRLQVKEKGSQNGIGIESASNTNHWDFYVDGNSASNLYIYYNGTYKGTFDNVTGAYTSASDRRLKKDITLYPSVLNNIIQLQAYQYHYLDNQINDRFANGFMAQDVQKLFPDAVLENTMKDGETRLGINYQYFTVLAIKGLQEQQQQIKKQEERITKLEAIVKVLMDKK